MTFRVDATGNSPKIDGVDIINLISGKVLPQEGQIVIPADPTQPVKLTYGNGTYTIGDKTITIGGLADDEYVNVEIDEQGNIKSITDIPKDGYIIVDGTTYTAPFDEATLTFDDDGWYFEGYTLPTYNVRIDAAGNISVDTGIKFSNVIGSGKTLTDGTIAIKDDESAVKITNESETALKVTETDGKTLAENLQADEAVTFSTEGVTADDLEAVAGATVYLDDGQSLTADGEATITADGNAQVAADETGINVAGSAQIEATDGTGLTLGEADYTINGAAISSSGKTKATAVEDGVSIDLAESDALTYDEMTLTGTDEAKAIIDKDGSVTLTGGTEATNTDGKALTLDGEVKLDAKTVNTAEAVEVTSTADGLNVGDTELAVGGDSGYQINIENGAITGLEYVSGGATIGGLSDATIKTDEAGSLTVADKTYTTAGDSGVTYGLQSGAITTVEELNGTISGDFSDGLTVNGDEIQVLSGLSSTIAAVAGLSGVEAIQTFEADDYTINGHAFETGGEVLFGMSGGSLTGAAFDDGMLAIGQDEADFAVNDEILTLNGNASAVTLGVSDGGISAVYGVNGSISGLSGATVYDLTTATVNGTELEVNGTDFDAEIVAGAVSSIVGLSSPATIKSAPDMNVVTSENGNFTFGGNTYNLNDTSDGSVTFKTDTNSDLTGINDFAGEVSGAVTSLNLNGKEFGTNNGLVTVSSDGENITRIAGVQNGDSIGGDLDKASFTMPQGNLTINGGEFTLADDADGAQASNGGKIITGMAKDASLTVGADGTYRVNGHTARASVGGVFTVNRDGGYLINPEHLPIIEKTPANVVRQRGGNGLTLMEGNGTVGAGKDSVAVRNNASVTVDSSGEPLIVATSGNVTLENYGDGNASIGTFEYTNISGAIKRNAITFGDGVMTLGDAVITFDEAAQSIGATMADLVNAVGTNQAIGFTHTAGGTINASAETEAQVLKGNYADKSGDTQKSGGSNIVGGAGNDTLLIGAGDTADGGAGNDRIYVTDGALRELGAQIILSAGKDAVTGFNGGYSTASDTIIISDLSAISFEAGSSNLVMKSGDSELTFNNMARSSDLVTSTDMAESSDLASSFGSDRSYRLKLNDGRQTYNAAIAQRGKNIAVVEGDLANVFYGDGSGVNFSEFTGAVSVNLDTGAGTVGNQSAQFHGINKIKGGAGISTLTGAEDIANTLIAGTGDGQIWSNSGNDLMVGQSDKTGTTTFQYLANDGQDTINGFEFATSADAAGDWINITTANEVTSVSLRGNNVVMYINGSETDYLTLTQGKGEDFRINNLTAKVDDRNLAFDGLANCYVADGTNATITVADSLETASVWLNDKNTGLHGTYYLGDITVVDGSKSAGSLILTGNALNNTIIGGAGTNSIWGGYGYDSDVMIGGSGKNTFFFALVNGNDVIQGAHDGDVIDLGTLTTNDIAGTIVNETGTAIGLTDGSVLEVRSNAAIEYKTADGTYIADHASGQWVKTK